MALICQRCSAPLPPPAASVGLVTCAYCGSTQPVVSTAPSSGSALSASTRAGMVISAVDFSSATTPGWVTTKYAAFRFGGTPPELVATMSEHHEKRLYTVLKSEGVYDDLDLSVTLRFLEGLAGTPTAFGIRAGVSFRLQSDGQCCYICDVTDDGWFGVHTIRVTEDNPSTFISLVKRTRFGGLTPGWGQPNRLRVVASGDRLRVFLNGQLAASLRDDHYKMGKVELLVGPAGQPGRVAFSELVLADP